MKPTKNILAFSIFIIITATHAADEPIGDSGVQMALAMLKLDLKTVHKNKSDLWWISQRKCMAETVDIVFSRSQLFDMAMKMPVSGKEAVLRDPEWTRFKSLLEYCQRKADAEIGR